MRIRLAHWPAASLEKVSKSRPYTEAPCFQAKKPPSGHALARHRRNQLDYDPFGHHCRNGNPLSDEGLALLGDASRGDREALARLLLQVGPGVSARLSIPENMRRDLDRDDVMQVTYLEAYLGIGKFEPHGVGSFVRWLEQIARRNLADGIKWLEADKRPPPSKRIAEIRREDSYYSLLDQLPDTATTASRRLARKELGDHLELGIRKLPPDYEKVIRWMDLEFHPVAVVAERMRRSKGAIHMLRARALEHLAELLETASKFL